MLSISRGISKGIKQHSNVRTKFYNRFLQVIHDIKYPENIKCRGSFPTIWTHEVVLRVRVSIMEVCNVKTKVLDHGQERWRHGGKKRNEDIVQESNPCVILASFRHTTVIGTLARGLTHCATRTCSWLHPTSAFYIPPHLSNRTFQHLAHSLGYRTRDTVSLTLLTLARSPVAWSLLQQKKEIEEISNLNVIFTHYT